MKKPAIFSAGLGLLGACAAVITCALPARPWPVDPARIIARLSTTRPDEQPTSLVPTAPIPDEYGILLKRSMFARRGSGPKVRTAVVAADTISVDLHNFSLRGVASQDGTFIAFVEQATQNTILRLRTGDEVAHGHVSEITLTGIEYEAAGETTYVEIGCRLDGSRPEATTQSTEAADPKTLRKKQLIGSGDPGAVPNGSPPSGESREKAK